MAGSPLSFYIVFLNQSNRTKSCVMLHIIVFPKSSVTLSQISIYELIFNGYASDRSLFYLSLIYHPSITPDFDRYKY